MAPIRPSNAERRRLREECREKLSNHIEERLGIKSSPSQVRLSPGPNDPYIWKFVPEKEDSIGSYREISEGVIKYFEAVPSSVQDENTQGSIVSLPDISFSTRIDQFEEENTRLCRETHVWEEKVTAASKRRQVAEQEARRLYERYEQMQEQIQRYDITVLQFKNAVSKCAKGLDGILPMIEELKVGVSFGVTTCNALNNEFCPTNPTLNSFEALEHIRTSEEL